MNNNNGENSDQSRITLGENGSEPIPRRREGFTGKKFLRYLGRSIKITFKYLGAKLLISAIIGIAAGVIFSLLKIDGEGITGAGWYGLLVGVCNCVPIIGQWICCVATVLLVWAFGSWQLALAALVVLIGLQILDEFVLTPLFVGKALSFKPLIIVLVMVAASIFCGPWGIIFAVPLAAVAKLGFELFYLRKDFDEIDSES